MPWFSLKSLETMQMWLFILMLGLPFDSGLLFSVSDTLTVRLESSCLADEYLSEGEDFN